MSNLNLFINGDSNDDDNDDDDDDDDFWGILVKLVHTNP